MEKFAVDLDRVLDEFEYNEDFAEEIARRGQKKCSSHLTEQYAQIDPEISSSEECHFVVSRKTSQTEYSFQAVNENIVQGRKLDDEVLHCDMKVKDLNESNSKLSSTKFLNNNTSNVKLNEARQPLNCKLNVSGVFSCLNEYINTGSISLHLNEADKRYCEVDKDKDKDVNKDITNFVTSYSSKSCSCEPENESIDNKQSESCVRDQWLHRQHNTSLAFGEEVIPVNQHNGDVITPTCSNIAWNGDTEFQITSGEQDVSFGYSKHVTTHEEKCVVASSDISSPPCALIKSETHNGKGSTEQIDKDKFSDEMGNNLKNSSDHDVSEKEVSSNVTNAGINSVPTVFNSNEEYSREFLNQYLNELELGDDSFASLEQCINTMASNRNCKEVADCDIADINENSSSIHTVNAVPDLRNSICPTPSADVCVSWAGNGDPVASTENSFCLPPSPNAAVACSTAVTTTDSATHNHPSSSPPTPTNHPSLSPSPSPPPSPLSSRALTCATSTPRTTTVTNTILSTVSNTHPSLPPPSSLLSLLTPPPTPSCLPTTTFAATTTSTSTIVTTITATTTSTAAAATTTVTTITSTITSTTTVPTSHTITVATPNATSTDVVASTNTSIASEPSANTCITSAAASTFSVDIENTSRVAVATSSHSPVQNLIPSDTSTFPAPSSDCSIDTSTTPVSEITTCVTSSSYNPPAGNTTLVDILPESRRCLDETIVKVDSSDITSGQPCNFIMHEEEVLSVEESPNVNTVVSIECQQIKQNFAIQPNNSYEVNKFSSEDNSCIQTNASKDSENHVIDDAEMVCSCTEDAVVEAGVQRKSTETSQTYFEKVEDQTSSCECSSEENTVNNDSGDTTPVLQHENIRNKDSFVEAMDTRTDEFDHTADNSASLATAEDYTALSSPDTSETSSVEVQHVLSSEIDSSSNEVGYMCEEQNKLGKMPPFWVPDEQAPLCMLCCCKFTVLKRRHHCRACGKVFCSKCCCQKYRLLYLNADARVCIICHDILVRGEARGRGVRKGSTDNPSTDNSERTGTNRKPNPNNPMEYCSTIPPLEQAANALSQPVPSVLVPVGVLKREGCSRLKSDVAKQVMFSDGIRPGGDLTEADTSSEQRILRQSDMAVKRVSNLSGAVYTAVRLSRTFDLKAKSFISTVGLPPLAVMEKGNLKLEDVPFKDMTHFLTSLRCETSPPAVFALNQNLFVQVKILNLDCCVNRVCWCFSTLGMSCVSQDEIVIILECLPEDDSVPTDIFHFLNTLYHDASKGILVAEMGHSVFKNSMFLGSSDHGGFLYIRPSFQCLHKIPLPPAPYLVGILIHRWEIPWAKLFPIRLMLRLGAEFRYYPCMLVSVQQREPVYCEIGHTIMNLLADFRNMSYTLPSVPGMVIHMEDKHTSILLPKNRYDQVARALNNSNDHVLALAANFSLVADSHLVCIQSPTDDSYHTQAINIHNKPRKVTGASFVVFNGALKISSNLMAKSTIVEDGLMVQITPDTIQELRTSLHKMKDFVVHCGPTSASVPDEIVDVRWVEEDRNFNIGVQSVIDGLTLNGVPSIRVHNGSDFLGKTRFIRWTEVFILQPGSIVEGMMGANDTVDVSHIAENLATATCMALCDFLDLLAQSGFTRIAVRANIHQDNVGYSVGGQGQKLPPIYMKTLDSTLVPVLHHTATVIANGSPIVLELLFHIMMQ